MANHKPPARAEHRHIEGNNNVRREHMNEIRRRPSEMESMKVLAMYTYPTYRFEEGYQQVIKLPK